MTEMDSVVLVVQTVLVVPVEWVVDVVLAVAVPVDSEALAAVAVPSKKI